MTYPYVLIQSRQSGRVPPHEIAKLASKKDVIEKAAQKQTKGMDGILSKLNVGEMLYDEDKHLMWLSIAMNVAGAGPVKMMGGVYFTEKGTISIYSYAKEAEFAAQANTFESIINSVSLAEDYRYKPRAADANPLLGFLQRVGGGAWRGALIGAGVGVVIALLRRKKRSPQPPPVP
jgi:hypothetical protein